VPSAYGQPMVMHDKTIVWAMFEADGKGPASLIGRAVDGANAQCDVVAEPPCDHGASTAFA
jgi:hypothetical protein